MPYLFKHIYVQVYFFFALLHGSALGAELAPLVIARDATLGYPGEGPERFARSACPQCGELTLGPKVVGEACARVC